MFSMYNRNLLFIILFVAWYCFSCNSNSPNPNRVQNPVRVELSTTLSTDSLFTPTGNAELDSLLQLASVAKQDTNLARLFYQIGDLYEDNNREKGKEYYLKLKSLSEQLDWIEGRLLSASSLSTALCREGLADSALVIISPALELAKRENKEEWIAVLYMNTGNAYQVKDWYETALRYYMDAMIIFERIKNTEKLGLIYRYIGNIYNLINLPEKSVEYCEKALVLLIDNPKYNVYALQELAKVYNVLQQYEKSNEYFEKALELNKQQNNLYLLEFVFFHLADNALMVFDLDRAEMYAKKMLEIYGSEKELYLYHGYLLLLGKLEQLKGNFAKSEKYALQALEIAIEYDAMEVKKICYILLSELSVAMHKYSDNIRYYKELEKVEVAIANASTQRASEEMAAKYETEKKELEIENQKQVIARQNIERSLLAGGIVVAVLILSLLWYLLRLRNRHNKGLAERNDALAEMNATKDKFFNIISHDIKNPAIAQRDALKRLVKSAFQWDADTLAKYYNSLLESAEGQVELVYNLLGWAQLQTGRMIFQPATFNLAASLRADIALIRGMAEKKGIAFAAQIADDADVTGDSNMIAAVVRNLLSNAVKFTPAGGMVTLEIIGLPPAPPPIEGGENFPPSGGLKGACISISDTGVGMSHEQIDNLFRLDVAHSRRGTAGEQGSGLGLIVCKELLEKHNTVLHVESETGKGSKFWFTM